MTGFWSRVYNSLWSKHVGCFFLSHLLSFRLIKIYFSALLRKSKVEHYARKNALLTEWKLVEFMRYAKIEREKCTMDSKCNEDKQIWPKHETEMHYTEIFSFSFSIFFLLLRLYFWHLFNYKTRVQLQWAKRFCTLAVMHNELNGTVKYINKFTVAIFAPVHTHTHTETYT